MSADPKAIERFETYIRERKLKRGHFFPGLDRLMVKLGLIDRPMAFMSYARHATIIGVYWFVAFPLIFELVFGVLFQSNLIVELSKVTPPLEFALLGVFHVFVSIVFGLLTPLFVRKKKKEAHLPDWSFFASDPAGA